MSVKPSPLKSPVPAMLQSATGSEPTADALKKMPPISHTPTPPAELRHKMSVKPSPLKSPVPAMLQSAGGNDPSDPDDMTAASVFISHTPTPPVELRHRMS